MELTKRKMVYAEAKDCIAKINANMTNIRSLVLDLYERKGWDALGYESWRECVVKEFQQGENYLYKQLAAAQAERNLCTTVQIPERQIRPLTRLNDDPEKQRVAWQKAVETAPEGKVTAAHVQKVVREMVEPERKGPKIEPKPEPPGYAIFHAINAISHLERIGAADPERFAALDRLQAWIDAKRKEWRA